MNAPALRVREGALPGSVEEWGHAADRASAGFLESAHRRPQRDGVKRGTIAPVFRPNGGRRDGSRRIRSFRVVSEPNGSTFQRRNGFPFAKRVSAALRRPETELDQTFPRAGWRRRPQASQWHGLLKTRSRIDGYRNPAGETSTDLWSNSSASIASPKSANAEVPGGASTSRPTSLLGPSSPRAMEPNTLTLRSPLFSASAGSLAVLHKKRRKNNVSWPAHGNGTVLCAGRSRVGHHHSDHYVWRAVPTRGSLWSRLSNLQDGAPHWEQSPRAPCKDPSHKHPRSGVRSTEYPSRVSSAW